MAKDKMTVTVDPAILADTDDDARRAGMSRSRYVETVLQEAHYQRLLAGASAPLAEAETSRMRAGLRWQADPGQAA